MYHATSKHKNTGMATLILDKIDLQTESIKRDKEGHFIVIKRSIHQENIIIINVYVPNKQ